MPSLPCCKHQEWLLVFWPDPDVYTRDRITYSSPLSIWPKTKQGGSWPTLGAKAILLFIPIKLLHLHKQPNLFAYYWDESIQWEALVGVLVRGWLPRHLCPCLTALCSMRERAIAGPSDLLVRIFQLVKVQPVGNGKKCMRKLLPVWCQDGWHLTQGWRHIWGGQLGGCAEKICYMPSAMLE